MLKKTTVFLAAIILAGCAKTPESITPAYVSDVGYRSWSCQNLAEEQQRLSAAYATAAGEQNQARTTDIVGVVLIGVPVSSMSGGNIAPQIARLKGEQEAVRRAMITKNCSRTRVSARR